MDEPDDLDGRIAVAVEAALAARAVALAEEKQAAIDVALAAQAVEHDRASAKALAEQAERLDQEARQALVAALAQQAGEAEAAASAAIIDRAFARLPEAISAAEDIERQNQAGLTRMFDGLAAAFDVALAIEAEAWAKRPLRVALFDEGGAYIGVMESRADLLDQQAADPFTRVAWREAWDGLRPEPVAGSRPLRWAVPMPRLDEIDGLTAEELARPFADYPVPALD